MSYQGIDVRATTDRLLFRSLLLDSAGIVVTAGPTVLRLYEVQSDGTTLKSFDFNDSTFKATALTTPTLAMTHCTGNAGTHNTGVWTVALTTLTGFTVGGIYLGEVYNATASPITQVREFQFGNAEGDLVVNAARLNVDATAISTSTTAADRLEASLTAAAGMDLNMGQTVPNPGTVDTTGRALRTAHDMSSLTTGFSATTPNNLNSYLKAMMSKAAVVPTGMGTYDPATDTLEVLRERLDLMTGAGFSTGTDSLAAIRDAIDTLLAPVVTASSAGSVGFLAECVSLVRRATDEPSITPKYTDADIIEYIHSAFDQVLAAVNIDTDHPILVRHNISVVNGTQEYILPCSVGEIWRLAKIDATTQLPVWELWPSNEYTFAGYGFTIEDNILRFGTPQVVTQTLQLLYMPNSEVSIHLGTAASATASTIVFAAVPTAGSLDIRPNGYAGYMVRVLSATTGAGQDRVVDTYDAVTRTATVRPAWTTTPTGTMVYEVLPQYSRLIKHVVVDYAALDVLSNEAKSARRGEIEKRIQRKMTALRNTLSKKVNRFGSRGPGVDTIDNQDLWPLIP